MTIKRTYLLITMMWSFSLFCGLIMFVAIDLEENHVCTYTFSVRMLVAGVYIFRYSHQKFSLDDQVFTSRTPIGHHNHPSHGGHHILPQGAGDLLCPL